MQLGELFDDLTFDLATAAIDVVSVEIDSRACTPGALFFAVPGATTSGVAHVAQAVANGAVAVVATEALACDVPVVVVTPQRLRLALGHAAEAVTGWPASDMQLVGVTGTNGKTSVATLIADLSRQLGWHGASIGTLTNARTTPAPPELWRSLAAIRASATTPSPSVVALEVSSHALDQERVAGVHFAVAVFTNLSHDHLDYHGTMEAYFAAKAKLFTPEFASRAVIWCDDPYGDQLRGATSLPVTVVRRSDAAVTHASLTGTDFLWRGHQVHSPLIGDYNIDNALLALATMAALGADEAELARAMAHVTPIPGRCELVSSTGPTVVVDYAHTPAGLERLLTTVRTLHEGRIITVFGCGGDRDTTKRADMGRIASTLSDVAVVTSDNPRTEDPAAIIDQVIAGCDPSRVERVIDRRDAIARALDIAGPSDVVVIAGKGHETTQIIGEHVLAFDDRAVARELLK